MVKLLPIVIFMGTSVAITAQQPSDELLLAEKLDLPKVFLIGEHEAQYESLYEKYNEILLSVANDDMTLAFDKWMNMLVAMENYADQIEFDIKGVKVWLKLFWNKDGTIDHLSYFLKPNSRNVEYAKMSAFFSSFINNYQMPIQAHAHFTHSGSAAFPTFATRNVTRKD